jgi:hypothetical protein
MPDRVVFGSEESQTIAGTDRVMHAARVPCPLCFDGEWHERWACDKCDGEGTVTAWEALDYLRLSGDQHRERYLNKIFRDDPVSQALRSLLKQPTLKGG